MIHRSMEEDSRSCFTQIEVVVDIASSSSPLQLGIIIWGGRGRQRGGRLINYTRLHTHKPTRGGCVAAGKEGVNRLDKVVKQQ